ncbi:hypothetical protein [Methylobacterium nigriterrae]|uniref:hypothetical protein n=1 Tax=Methylobacterium nigriterrae TaxID=3127512 RepID=UPI003013B98D
MAQRAVITSPQRAGAPDRGCTGNEPAVERTLQSVAPMLERVFRLVQEEPFPEEIAGFIERLHAGPLGERGARARQVA